MHRKWKLLFFFFFSQHRSTTKCLALSACLWLLLCVCPFLCPCVFVCMRLFGQAVKNWFRVCCFEPTAKCCLTNSPCSENKSFSRSPPTNHSSLFLSPASSLHDSLPLGFFSCLTLIYFNPTSPFLWLRSFVSVCSTSAAQIWALHMLRRVITLSCERRCFVWYREWASARWASFKILCSMRLWQIRSQETQVKIFSLIVLNNHDSWNSVDCY